MKQNNQILYGLIGVIMGGTLSWLAINSVNNNTWNMMAAGQVYNQNIDSHFIEQMIPHHEDAITMAKLAQTKAKRPEVKQLANSIIVSQANEVTQMKDWYKSWFGKDVPIDSQVMNQYGMMGNNSRMHMGMMGDESDMTRLENATDFDKAFIEEMIPHHQMAIMMASMLKGGTNRPEMNKLAEDIISTQTSEINKMRQWLKDWGISSESR